MIITDKKVIQMVRDSLMESGEMPTLFDTIYLVYDCMPSEGEIMVSMVSVFFDGRNLRGESQVYGHPEEIAGDMILASTFHKIISQEGFAE